MALDPVINFGKVAVSTGYNSTVTSVDLSSGDGSKLPSVFDYNLVWWNATDYSDPADDPNVEIVRCTAKSTDTLTISRAQEGTSASTKNTSAKSYKMILAVTKKMIDDITSSFLDMAIANTVTGHTTFSGPVTVINGGTSFSMYISSSNTIATGEFNTTVGVVAGSALTTGAHNTLMGAGAGNLIEDGSSNVCVGRGAGSTNVSGIGNTYFGTASGLFATGNRNTMVGNGAGETLSTGEKNTFIGVEAGEEVTTGNNNILIGERAGEELTTGSNNIVIGYNIDPASVTSDNQLNIGNLLYGTGIDGLNNTISSGNIGIGIKEPTEKLDIDGDSVRLRTAKTPSSASDTGTQGQIAWDSDYIYVCVATNTWKRTALSTW